MLHGSGTLARTRFAPTLRWVRVLLVGALVLGAGCVRSPAGTSQAEVAAPIEVAVGEAFVGPWRMNDSDFRYVDDPTVAIGAGGMVAVAWADQAEQDIFLQRYGADDEPQLDAPVNISRSPDTFSWLPRLVTPNDAPRTVYALWQEIVFSGGSHGGEIYFARSNDGGASFSEPINLSNTIAGAGKGRLSPRRWDNGSLDLAIDESGNLHAAWTEYEGALHVSRSTDGGESFSEPRHILGDPTTPARAPALAVGGQGRVYLAWTVGEDDAADVHLVRSDDAGRSYDEPRVVLESDGHIDAPRMAVDREGVVHLAYAEGPAGRFERYAIHYARSTDGAASFEAPRPIANPEATWIEGAAFPELVTSGDEQVALLWNLYPAPAERPRALAFTHSDDGGDRFPSARIWPGTTAPEGGAIGSLQGLLMRRLAVNAHGEVAVVASHFKPADMSRIRLFRGQLDGTQ